MLGECSKVNIWFQKICILSLPLTRNFLIGVGGFRNLTKKLKKFIKLNLHFLEGKGAGEKISLIGEVWIFSGTTTHFYQKPAPVYQYLPTNWDVEMFLKVFSYGFSV